MSLSHDLAQLARSALSHWGWLGSGSLITWILTKSADWYAIERIPHKIRVEGKLEITYLDRVHALQNFLCEVKAVNASNRQINISRVYLECVSELESWPKIVEAGNFSRDYMKIEPHLPKFFAWNFRRVDTERVPLEISITPTLEIFLPPRFYRRKQIDQWARTIKGETTKMRVI